MEAIAIKNKTLADIQAALNIAIEAAEKNGAFDYPLSEHFHKKQAKTPDKKEDAIYEYLRYSSASEILDEQITIEHGLFKCDITIWQAIYLQRKVKNKFGNGKSKQPTKSKKSELDAKGKELQTYIANLRADYHGYDYLSNEENERRKKAVVKAYKKSDNRDIIRECWKWITSNKNIEGIHLPYSEKPQAIFTPYKSFKVENISKSKNVA